VKHPAVLVLHSLGDAGSRGAYLLASAEPSAFAARQSAATARRRLAKLALRSLAKGGPGRNPAKPESPVVNHRAFWRRRAISYLCLFCLLLECGVVLAPILKTGYFSDDLMNAMENARAHYMGWNAFQYYLQQIHSLIWDGHRLMLFSGPLVIPYLVPNLILYKSMVVAGVTGNVILFAYYLNSVLKSRYFGFFVAGIIPLLLQFRLYHDPVLSFHLFLQGMAFWMLLTLFFLNRYVVTRRRHNLIISLIAFNLFLYSYEVSYLFPVVVAGAAWLTNRTLTVRQLCLLIMPYVFSALVAVGLALLVRDKIGATYEGAQFQFAPFLICKTFTYQVFSAFPLSYHLGRHGVLFGHTVSACAGMIIPTDLLALGALVFLYLAGAGITRLRVKRFMVLGGLLLVFPAVMIAISKKYQYEIPYQGLGVGYLVVYLQYFGTALLLGAVVVLINRIRKRYLRFFLHGALLAGLTSALLVTLQDNRLVIAKANAALTSRWVYLANALQKGVLAPAPPDASVLMKDDYDHAPVGFLTDYEFWAYSYPWRNKYFVFQYAGKRVNTFQKIRPFLDAPGDCKYILLMSNWPSARQPGGACVNLYRVDRIRERTGEVDLYVTRQTRWNSGDNQTEWVAGQTTITIDSLNEKCREAQSGGVQLK